MNHTRRTVLRAGIGLGIMGSIAGCSSDGSGTNTSTETPDRLYALSGTYTLEAGQFRDFPLDIEDPAVIEYTVNVRSGPNIDILVLSRGDFREYERGNTFEIIESASAPDTSYGDVTADLGPTDINIVFDNTEAGTAAPPDSNGTVELLFELTVSHRNT